MSRFKRIAKKTWPLLLIFLVWIALFRPFFFKGLLPIPADIIAGVYYPWLDYKWGYAVGVPVKNPLLSDIPSLLYPWRTFAIDQLKSGRWPLWNPYYFGGMPLLANFQSAVFSYVNLFFLFFPKEIAWAAGVTLSPILTMIALYFFLKDKIGEIPALLGSITFGLSGFQIAWLEYNVHGHTVLFFILILIAIDKIFRGGKGGWYFLLSIFIALQIFAGYLPIVIYGYLVSGLYALYFFIAPKIKRKEIELKKLLRLVFFVVLGIAMASIQLLPGIELARNSIRLTDPTVEAAGSSYLPWQNFITLLAPDFFGNPGTHNYFGPGFYDNFSFFVGTGVVLLVTVALFSWRKNTAIKFWSGCLALSLLLAVDNPPGRALSKMLFLSGGVAARALFITDFSLAILAAYGLMFLMEGKVRAVKAVFSGLLILLAFMVIYHHSSSIVPLGNRLIAQRNLVIPFGVYAVSFLSVLVLALKPRWRWLLGLTMVLVASGQLLYSASKYLPFSKAKLVFPKTPVLEYLIEQKSQSQEPFRVELGDVIPQNFLMPYGLETTSGYDALLPRTTGEFLTRLEKDQVDKRISRVQLIRNYNSRLFPLTNSRFMLAKKINKDGLYDPEGSPPDEFLANRYHLIFEDKTVQVYEDTKALPRAFWVYDYKTARNQEEFASLIKKINFAETAILDNDLGLRLKGQGSSGAVVWEEYRPGKMTLRAESDRAGLIVLLNTFFPGWKAKVNGNETRLLRANGAFMSIFVPAGESEITINYWPFSFYQGLFISLSALTIWGAGLFLALFKWSIDLLEKQQTNK